MDYDFYRTQQPDWGFSGLGFAVFKRTYARPVYDHSGNAIRTEEWWETVRRVVEGAQDIGAGLTDDEAARLYDYIFNLKGTVAGRGLWQLGTDNIERLGQASCVNCYFTHLRKVEDFAFLFNMLMLGGGVGFSTIHDPFGTIHAATVTHEPEAHDSDFIVPDKREGWSELLVRVLKAFQTGEDFTYSTVLVRPEGAPIKTFGGVASGPGILVDGVAEICKILTAADGRSVTSVEILDIANIIGSIVVSGNVRRSAQIALGLPDDTYFLQAKRWDLGNIPSYRAMSNNSVIVDDIEELPDEFWEGYGGHGEPYGMVNLSTARLYGRVGDIDFDATIEGTNPCAEIMLADKESCNLAEIFLPNIESEEELFDVAKLLYKVQKAVASLKHPWNETDEITSQNMRLGLSVTGVAMAADKLDWLSSTYEKLRDFDTKWSEERGWPRSVRLTTVKPSGTLSLLAGVTPGVHGGYSQFHIRRVRMSANDPVFAYCQERGYPWEFVRDFEGREDPRTVVVEFPASFPEGTRLASEMSAVEQLELQARLQQDWADNAVSVTVTYRPEELADIKVYLKEHWVDMKSVSFLPYSDHGFDQAPLEPITEDEYHRRVHSLNGQTKMILGGPAELLDGDACLTGACPVR